MVPSQGQFILLLLYYLSNVHSWWVGRADATVQESTLTPAEAKKAAKVEIKQREKEAKDEAKRLEKEAEQEWRRLEKEAK